MEMFGIAGGILLFAFLVTGGIISLIRGRAARPFALGCLLPGTIVFLIATLGMGRYLTQTEPLFMTASDGNITEVRSLLADGASPNADFEGTSALSAAAGGGYLDVVTALIAHGATVATDESKPPLNAAVVAGHVDIVRLLITKSLLKNSCLLEGVLL